MHSDTSRTKVKIYCYRLKTRVLIWNLLASDNADCWGAPAVPSPANPREEGAMVAATQIARRLGAILPLAILALAMLLVVIGVLVMPDR